jgi:hypothetical protein
MPDSQQGHQAVYIPQTATNADTVEIEIVNDTINDAHSQDICETEDIFKASRTVKEHNQQLGEMIRWVQHKYPDYYNQCVVELSDDQKNDTKRYYNSMHDFL